MKFLQNVGRSTRLHSLDRQRLEDDSLKPADWERYIKPKCHVILPMCVHDHNDFVDRYAIILDEMRRYYDFDPSQIIHVDILSPAQQGPEFDEDELKRQIRGTIREDVKDFFYIKEERNLDLQETLMVSKFRRFVTDDEPLLMIKLVGKY